MLRAQAPKNSLKYSAIKFSNFFSHSAILSGVFLYVYQNVLYLISRPRLSFPHVGSKTIVKGVCITCPFVMTFHLAFVCSDR